MKTGKMMELLRIGTTNPREFRDRIEIILSARLSRARRAKSAVDSPGEIVSMPAAIQALSDALGTDLRKLQQEAGLQALWRELSRRSQMLSELDELPYSSAFIGDPTLVELCYLLVRATRPTIAFETGVGYGATTGAILAAMVQNDQGTLHSIDLPPLGDAQGRYTGFLVSEDHRDRWRLHRGLTRRTLPGLLAEGIAPVGFFLHDSSNVSSVQTAELRRVWPHLSSRGTMVLNNVGDSSAFASFVAAHRPALSLLIRQTTKQGQLTGLIIAAPKE